jgi:saccharopine dehydrogenase (NADP+, L-glutamate forming)
MKTALIVGAGKSSLFLIEYLLRGAADGGYRVVVADADPQAAAQKIGGHPSGTPIALDATNDARKAAVESADVVCSLLPPTLHILLAHDCLAAGKPLITASYVSDEMRALDAEARAKGLLFMCEMGLDPGIDHMSAMKIIHHIQEVGGRLDSFVSACGGLVAPESDDNPWHYKFSWNPMNVVNAGRDGARFLRDGEEVTVPYEHLFQPQWARLVKDAGLFGAYPNRDSVPYAALYGLPEIPTLIRLTFRDILFMAGWTYLIYAGYTRNAPGDRMITAGLSPYAVTARLTGCPLGTDLRIHLASLIFRTSGDDKHHTDAWELLDEQLTSIGLLSTDSLESFGVPQVATPAEILYHLLLRAWAMRPDDKDMVVMQHEFGWTEADGQERKSVSTLVIKGENAERTAMAKTVGLPMGILARMVLRGEPGLPTGVCIPTMQAVYEPVLRELEKEGVRFTES